MNSNDPYENLDFIPPMYDDICPGYDPKVFKNAKRFIIVMLLILALSIAISVFINKSTDPQKKTTIENVECSTIK